MADDVSPERLLAEIADLRQQVASMQADFGRRSERVVVFVDNTNLNFTTRRMDATRAYRLCYKKLVDHLVNGRCLRQVRIYYSDTDRYAALAPEAAAKRAEREGFYNWLRWQGYWLKCCPQVGRSDGTTKEKGLDAAIVKDMERTCQRNVCDTVVLVAGDGDYHDVVVEAQSVYSVKVEVAFFPEFAAGVLQGAASRFVNLAEARESLRHTNAA